VPASTRARHRSQRRDPTTSLPRSTFEFDPVTGAAADALLERSPATVFHCLLRDQESPEGFLAARRILHAFLSSFDDPADTCTDGADAASWLAARVLAARDELAGCIRSIGADAETRDAVLRQRAPLALLAGCWLDTVSQPATQPAAVVNRLYRQYFRLQGEGNPQRSVQHLRRRALEDRGIFLPELDASDFCRRAQTRPLTAWHALFYLALSRLPASFLPEVVAVHCTVSMLGVDDQLLGTAPMLDQPQLRETLAEFLSMTVQSPTGGHDRCRLRTAVELTLCLEREHVASLAELAAWQSGLSLEAKVAAIIERHAPYAARHHHGVRVGGRPLTDAFADPQLDLAAFVRQFRDSRQLKPNRGGTARFLRAIKFGGPMFGIFDDQEAAVFAQWADATASGDLPEPRLSPNRVGDAQAAAWAAAVAQSRPEDVAYRPARPTGHREWLHRLVNIEAFPNTLPLARCHAAAVLDRAEVMFRHGQRGRYTDASYFDYTADALFERVERIYRDKLVGPYRPLAQLPSREQVLDGQRSAALGSLVDGAWAYRIGNLGRYRRSSDGILFSVYADEMGRGDLRKNHIVLIHQVLDSMRIGLPHIRDAAFLAQDQIPDSSYEYSIYELCLALFPDTYYNEILGFNLGSEMYGLGEVRLHEIQKLRAYGFDTTYEEVHLSIDNVSSGHARQSAELIVGYLDDVARNVGARAVAGEWRRIWRGYASFAYFAEPAIVDGLTSGANGPH
jgi:hypothetical protein